MCFFIGVSTQLQEPRGTDRAKLTYIDTDAATTITHRHILNLVEFGQQTRKKRDAEAPRSPQLTL
jgi:hypothetical protein